MRYIAYYRVSTRQQGQSGLGLKAQQEAVERFIAPELIYQSFTEVETGTNKKHRPILTEAIALCKELDATLIIAKLDRLSRNVSFINSLMDSKVQFKAVDMPQADHLQINIMSAIAQHEAKLISKRIKDALAQSDKKLGNPQNFTSEGRKKGIETIKRNRENNPHNKRALAHLKAISSSGTLQQLANSLNEEGFRTSKGKLFNPIQVSRLLKRL